MVSLALLLGCSAESQSALTDEVQGTLGDLGADGVALLAQVEEIDRNVRELADGLRRRVKRMEERLAALETAVAKAAAQGERLKDAAGATTELAAQVAALSAELDRLEAAGAALGGTPSTTTCAVGETWNAVLQTCAP
jgi:ABC-type transporter Mla subunit MlaD